MQIFSTKFWFVFHNGLVGHCRELPYMSMYLSKFLLPCPFFCRRKLLSFSAFFEFNLCILVCFIYRNSVLFGFLLVWGSRLITPTLLLDTGLRLATNNSATHSTKQHLGKKISKCKILWKYLYALKDHLSRTGSQCSTHFFIANFIRPWLQVLLVWILLFKYVMGVFLSVNHLISFISLKHLATSYKELVNNLSSKQYFNFNRQNLNYLWNMTLVRAFVITHFLTWMFNGMMDHQE